MKITAIVEKTEGNFEFTAEISELQHQFLLEYAVRDLISKGLVPFHVADTDKSETLVVIPDYDSQQANKH